MQPHVERLCTGGQYGEPAMLGSRCRRHTVDISPRYAVSAGFHPVAGSGSGGRLCAAMACAVGRFRGRFVAPCRLRSDGARLVRVLVAAAAAAGSFTVWAWPTLPLTRWQGKAGPWPRKSLGLSVSRFHGGGAVDENNGEEQHGGLGRELFGATHGIHSAGGIAGMDPVREILFRGRARLAKRSFRRFDGRRLPPI